jgi:hypothetical protein
LTGKIEFKVKEALTQERGSEGLKKKTKREIKQRNLI